MKPSVSTLWVGRPLSLYEQAALVSFCRAGYETNVYTYGDDIPLPQGILRQPAASVIPEEEVFANGRDKGTFAGFSDIFRYRLLQLFPTVWIDTDVLAGSTPISSENGYVFGFEDDEVVNGAVLGPPSKFRLFGGFVGLLHVNSARRPQMGSNWTSFGEQISS